VFALTNGNASLTAIGIETWFEGVITARQLGVAKPEPAFFERALAHAGLAPGETLHIGDHPENDIRAAQAAGLTALWLNRTGAEWVLAESAPDHELSSLVGLPDLLR
jgi:putative hydrolase of the HAD superfamily